nr:DNA-directed DNA polymerase [Tanacetum cinerariifolium]
MLRACPHHGFSELTQIDTFYNGLNEQDQDSLNATAGGNLLSKLTREALKIIENKSKVRYSRSKSNVSRVNTNYRDSSSKTDDRIDKLADQISNLVEIVNKQVITPATAKAVKKICVICGGAHAYYDCNATDINQPSVCAATRTYNQVSLPNRASNQIPSPGFAPVQNNPNRGDFNKQEENIRRNLNNDMRSILGSFFKNQASTLGTLPSNIVPNPKGEMKAVTTRSGLAYEGPSIPTNYPFEKVVERDTEEIMDKERSNCQGSTAHIQPPAVPISISKLDVPKTQPKPNIPYPSRLNDQKLYEKATNQLEKFFQIFHDFHFDISFADALLLMPKFASTIKSLLTNKDKLFEIDVCHALADLGASINLMPLSIWKKLSLSELTLTRMTLELADRSITRPKRVAEDVFVKVGKFHFPTDFVVVDIEADPKVPLILGRSFLRNGRALIDVYGEEITLRVNDESVTINLNQTMRYSLTYDDNSVNRVDVIDIACEEFVQDVLDFQYNSKSSNPTLFSNPSISKSDFCKEPIVKSFSPTLTPFGEKEETKANSSIEEPPELELKELPCHLEYAFLEETDKLPVIIAKDLKYVEKEALIKVLKSHKRAIAWKNSDIKGIDLRFCTHKILMEEDYKPAVQSKRQPIFDSPWASLIYCVPKKGGMTVISNENNELTPTRLVTGWRVCIDYRKLNDATRKDHFPSPFMDQMLERLAENEFYCLLDGFLGYFQIPIDPQDQEKTTFTCPYETFAYRRMPFGLCNAPGHAGFYRRFIQDFSKIARHMTHLLEKETPFVFSKECVDAFDTLMKKLTKAPILIVPDWNLPFELMCDASDFAIVYAFEKFRPYLVLSKSIVYTDHSALKYLLSKQDAKPRLLRWVLLLQEFDITIRDKKRSENFAADHLSRLENPHKDVLENKDINENFPLETLGSLSSDSTPWFADIPNFHARNFIKKGLTSQQKKKFFKDVKHYFWDDPYLFGTPRAIISDRGTHFCDDLFARVMIKYGVTHRLATAYHPHTSGQVEVSNRGLKRILKRTVRENQASWSDKLDDALWAFHIVFKTPIGYTPYKLVYGKSCHLPIELKHKAYWALKHVNFDLKTAGDHQKLQLNELNELHDQAYTVCFESLLSPDLPKILTPPHEELLLQTMTLCFPEFVPLGSDVYCLVIPANDMVIHTEKTGVMRLVVEIDVNGMIADMVDKVTCSFDGLQLEQVDLNQLELLSLQIIHNISLAWLLHCPQLSVREHQKESLCQQDLSF